MANEFPIQFVQFRDERDDFLAEGGGNSTLPTWVNDETISANATRMQSHLMICQRNLRIEYMICLF